MNLSTHLGNVCGALLGGGGPLRQLQLLQVDALDQLLPLLAPLPAAGDKGERNKRQEELRKIALRSSSISGAFSP